MRQCRGSDAFISDSEQFSRIAVVSLLMRLNRLFLGWGTIDFLLLDVEISCPSSLYEKVLKLIYINIKILKSEVVYTSIFTPA